MKIRAGFVSNSSSSCFICGKWGMCKYSIKETIDILQKILDFYNGLEEENLFFNDVFEKPRKAKKEDIKFLINWDVPENRTKGKTLIFSKRDNSVPYLLFGFIEQKFAAERIHLG